MKLFAHPIFFIYFIPAVLLLAGLLWLGKKLKQRVVRILFSTDTYLKITDKLSTESPLKTVLLFGALVFLFTALAAPQWGTEIVQAQGSFSQTIIAVDVSSSMRAQDFKPDRLKNAQNMLQMLISHMHNERIGIIAFTSQAYVQSPITTDEDALRSFIQRLQPDMLPVPGTSLAAPVSLAARLLAKYAGKKALILLTDGEDHSPEELKQAQEIAVKNSIRIIAIGIGTKEGALIPVRIDNTGRPLDYKRDKAGNTVVSKLDEKSLLSLAQATGGVYIPYTSPVQVAAQVEEAVKDLDRSSQRITDRVKYKNRYQIPLTLAILCLGAWLLWPPRRKPNTP